LKKENLKVFIPKDEYNRILVKLLLTKDITLSKILEVLPPDYKTKEMAQNILNRINIVRQKRRNKSQVVRGLQKLDKKEEIKKLVLDGFTSTEIADKLSCTRQWINKLKKEFNIEDIKQEYFKLYMLKKGHTLVKSYYPPKKAVTSEETYTDEFITDYLKNINNLFNNFSAATPNTSGETILSSTKFPKLLNLTFDNPNGFKNDALEFKSAYKISKSYGYKGNMKDFSKDIQENTELRIEKDDLHSLTITKGK
jgi:hypothetical protein